MIRNAALAVSAAATLLAQACATAPKAPAAPPPPAFTRPAADRLARLQPFDRGAVEIDGELLRIAVVPPEPSTVAGVRVRRAEPTGPTVVAIREEAGAPVYTYVGPAAGWREGIVNRSPAIHIALQAARDATPFHEPVASRIGESEVWCTLDKVPKSAGASPGFQLTLALSRGNPRARAAPGAPAPAVRGGAGRGGPRSMEEAIAAKVGAASALPFAVLELQQATGPDGRGGDPSILRARGDKPIRSAGGIATLGDVRLEPGGKLVSVSLSLWRPPPEFFLAGKTARDVWSEPDRATEQAINDGLVEWKTRQLPGWLRQSTGAQLEDAIVKTEKGILALDVAVRSVKDQIDAAARKNESAFAEAGGVEQLLEQRKMLLGVVVQAMKGAVAQKAR